MKRLLLLVVLVAAIAGLAPAGAAAFPGASFSLGEGALMGSGDTTRTHVNGEAMLFYSLVALRLDLGVLMDLEEPDSDITVRPGARLGLGELCYLRGAIPMTATSDTQWGFLAGIGKSVVDLVAFRVFGELDATFMEAANFTDVVPVEVRVGVEIGF